LITHFLGGEQVDAYTRDLAARFLQQEKLLRQKMPIQWFVLSHSGQEIAHALAGHLPDPIRQLLRIVRTECNRTTKKIRFRDSIEGINFNNAILVLDSAVHSGKSMLLVLERLTALGAKNVLSYTLVLKRGSCFIPNYFGVVIDDTDRAFFQLDAIPNNRLIERKPSFGYLRALQANDVHRKNIRTGVKSIDGMTFGDMLYEKTVRPTNVYLYMHRDEICGYVSFEKVDQKLFIDVVASGLKFRGKGVGAALSRWAETWGRSCHCALIELWAIKNRIDHYRDFGFETVPGADELTLSTTEKYQLMRKPILYNTPIGAP
jgi:hypothetical protein